MERWVGGWRRPGGSGRVNGQRRKGGERGRSPPCSAPPRLCLLSLSPSGRCHPPGRSLRIEVGSTGHRPEGPQAPSWARRVHLPACSPTGADHRQWGRWGWSSDPSFPFSAPGLPGAPDATKPRGSVYVNATISRPPERSLSCSIVAVVRPRPWRTLRIIPPPPLSGGPNGTQ